MKEEIKFANDEAKRKYKGKKQKKKVYCPNCQIKPLTNTNYKIGEKNNENYR